MARRPFYGQGGAIPIAKMNMQAATAPGRAYRDAFENLGKVGADVLNKFREAKKEKQEEEDFVNMGKQIPWESFKAFGVKNEDERDAFINRIKKKDTREQAINLVKFSTEQEQAQEVSRVRDLQGQQIMRNMERQESANQLAGEKRMVDNQFMQSLMSQTTSPQAQRQADIAMPGLPALGNTDARNRFMQAQLQQPQNQVPVSNLGSQDFGRFAREQGLDPTRSVQRMEALRQAEAEANKGTGKTMNVFDPDLEQNVIALQNPDGTPGKVVGFAPTQPRRIPTPEEIRKTNIDKTEDDQAMDTEADWRGRAITGRNTTQTVKTMLSTLDKVEDTGGFSNFKNTLKKYAMSAGYDFTDAEKDQLANAEKFTQLSGEFVFKAISQTKGSISEKEMDLFQAMSPSMVNSKLGNRLMLEYAQKRADRDVKLNKYIQGLKKEGMLPQERVEMAMVWLNDPANDITQDLYEHFGTPTNGSPPPPQAQPNRPGVRRGNPQPSQGSQTSGGFQIKTR